MKSTDVSYTPANLKIPQFGTLAKNERVNVGDDTII